MVTTFVVLALITSSSPPLIAGESVDGKLQLLDNEGHLAQLVTAEDGAGKRGFGFDLTPTCLLVTVEARDDGFAIVRREVTTPLTALPPGKQIYFTKAHLANPRVSPDGKALVFAEAETDSQKRLKSNWRIQRLDLTKESSPQTVGYGRQAAWFADGSLLIHSAVRRDGNPKADCHEWSHVMGTTTRSIASVCEGQMAIVPNSGIVPVDLPPLVADWGPETRLAIKTTNGTPVVQVGRTVPTTVVGCAEAIDIFFEPVEGFETHPPISLARNPTGDWHWTNGTTCVRGDRRGLKGDLWKVQSCGALGSAGSDVAE